MVQRRTNQGQMIDMDALALKNEKEIALGNMKVNARGDKLGKGGKIIAEGKPEEICKINSSYTGKFLKPLLN